MMELPVVLLVEDEFLIRLATADALGRAGFFVLEAEDANEAICVLEERDDIRIIFTDIDLGSTVDGVEMLHSIAGRWPPIRLFATSGAAAHRSGERLPMGAAFFTKPYNDAELIDAFRRALAA
jgi:two-component system, response regulator PdtaR